MTDTRINPSTLEVSDYLVTIKDQARLTDAEALLTMIGRITGQPPVMWYKTIVGFGSYHYKYASGREGDSMKIGLSARKEHIVLYGVLFYDKNVGLLDQLGKVKQGKGCLYVKKLSDVKLDVLERMIEYAYGEPAPTEG